MTLDKYVDVVLDPDDGRAALEHLDHLVSFCRAQGLEAGVLDEAESFIKGLPINEAIQSVIADLCAGTLQGVPYGNWDGIVEVARERLKEKGNG